VGTDSFVCRRKEGKDAAWIEAYCNLRPDGRDLPHKNIYLRKKT